MGDDQSSGDEGEDDDEQLELRSGNEACAGASRSDAAENRHCLDAQQPESKEPDFSHSVGLRDAMFPPLLLLTVCLHCFIQVRRRLFLSVWSRRCRLSGRAEAAAAAAACAALFGENPADNGGGGVSGV